MTKRQPIPAAEVVGTQEGVIEAYCMLQGFVNERVFEFQLASDCFCHENDRPDTPDNPFWRSDPEVYDFIREAVMEKIDRLPTFKVTTEVYVDALDEDDALRKFERLVDSDTINVGVKRLDT